ncbi:MAG: pyridoxal phosphate-dependent aminotransferase family protein [Spirochaetes bacterium]|nr:pyridoxal phosphate-dependent aminotransferase family protein [Spirochaetota bacterium]
MRNKCADAYQEVLSTGRLNSDNYTLADFYTIDSDDIFTKTVPYYEYVKDYKEKKYYSYQRQLVSACNHRVKVKDPWTGEIKEMIMMGSNNYLGLITHPKVVEAGINAYQRYGSGASSAPLLSGTYDITRELELKLAKFKGTEDALVFSTGYSANVGTISALLRPGDVAIIDKLDHASIIDGCRLSGADLRTFKHQDIDSLEKCLETCKDKYKGKLIIVDGVYSMDGDICPLPEIKKMSDKYDARLMVDDAHATGVIGLYGKGTAEYFNMEDHVDLILGTFSKTLGAVGGFVAASTKVINYLRFYSRSYFFSAALPPNICATVKAAIEVIEEQPELIQQLHNNVEYLHSKLKNLGLRVTPPGTGIITVILNDEVTLRKMSKVIHEKGLFINPLPFPSVPRGEPRFKLSLMATHTQEALDEAANIFEEACNEFDIIESKVYAMLASV